MAVAREAADGLDAMIHTANVFKRVDDPEEVGQGQHPAG